MHKIILPSAKGATEDALLLLSQENLSFTDLLAIQDRLREALSAVNAAVDEQDDRSDAERLLADLMADRL